MLDEVLVRRLQAHHHDGGPGISAEVAFAWQRLVATGGTVPVSDVAAETGWSARHLRARFCAPSRADPEGGGQGGAVRPVEATAAASGGRGRAADLAGLAAHCGYYDQAHLDADFRVLAGAPPTAWLAAEFRNLQASAPVPGATLRP